MITHKKISMWKSWIRIVGLAFSILAREWKIGAGALVAAEILGIYEEQCEDVVTTKLK